MYVVFAGGIGAARFLRGLTAAVGPAAVTAIVNVGDDIEHLGLRICPDLDSITYWLSGSVHPEQQWGRADERFTVAEELDRFGHPSWFTLGDRDLAVHLHRTYRLGQGASLTTVTAEIVEAFGLQLTLLPATDDRVETRIHTADGRDLGFQEYWVRERARPPVARVELHGAENAHASEAVLAAIEQADAIILAPSNPVVSIGTILDIAPIRTAIQSSAAPVVGVSPIISGRVVRGMADRLLPAIGVDVSASGVAAFYRALLDGWILDNHDADQIQQVEALGIRCVATNTLMDELDIASELAQTCLSLAQMCSKAVDTTNGSNG
ncbi:MAG: 2-phospho-L-lactate transferase [Nitriliruptoraceae bacterium]